MDTVKILIRVINVQYHLFIFLIFLANSVFCAETNYCLNGDICVYMNDPLMDPVMASNFVGRNSITSRCLAEGEFPASSCKNGYCIKNKSCLKLN